MNPSDYIDTKEKWTQNAFARDKYGERCMPYDENAVAFCLTGAVERWATDTGLQYNVSEDEYLDALVGFIENQYDDMDDIVFWNDNPERKYEEVIEVMHQVEEYLYLR